MSSEGQTIREAHAGAMNALGADVHPYSASAIRDHEKVMGEALAAFEARLQRYEAALRLVREAYRPYREDMVMEALAAVDAALDSPATQETGE